MYEELHEKSLDVECYFERIGLNDMAAAASAAQLPRADGMSNASAVRNWATKETLDRLILAHQCTVPFENLDVCDCRVSPSLGIADIFQKIVVEKRGGYCFELNALFAALLENLGFDVRPCFARSLKDCGYVQPITHRAAIVVVEGVRCFCDVGYGGPQPAAALPLEDGIDRVVQGQVFRVEKREGAWWDLLYCGSEAKLDAARAEGRDVQPMPVLAFLDEPVAEEDFVPLSHYCSTHPDSVFTQKRMVNIRTIDGNASITADVFTRVTREGREERVLASDDEFRAVLAETFGIMLSQ